MINKMFWQKIADNWSTDDDGISIPDIEGSGIELIDPSTAFSDIDLDEVDDILADLDLDDDI